MQSEVAEVCSPYLNTGNFPGLIFTLWKMFKGNVSQTLGRGDWDPNLNNSQGGSRTSFRSRHLGKPNRCEGKGWIFEESRWGMFLKEHHGDFRFLFGGRSFVEKKTLWLRDHHFFWGWWFLSARATRLSSRMAEASSILKELDWEALEIREFACSCKLMNSCIYPVLHQASELNRIGIVIPVSKVSRGR